MRVLFQTLSWLALAGTILPCLLASPQDLEQIKQMMLWSTVAWFVFTPMWLGRTVHATPG